MCRPTLVKKNKLKRIQKSREKATITLRGGNSESNRKREREKLREGCKERWENGREIECERESRKRREKKMSRKQLMVKIEIEIKEKDEWQISILQGGNKGCMFVCVCEREKVTEKNNRKEV